MKRLITIILIALSLYALNFTYKEPTKIPWDATAARAKPSFGIEGEVVLLKFIPKENWTPYDCLIYKYYNEG